MTSEIFVFIDASNVWAVQKAKGKTFDYQKLRKYLHNLFSNKSITFYYYTAFPKKSDREYDVAGKHKFYTYLKKSLGFVVIKKPLKRISIQTKDGFTLLEKGNMDVEITIDALDNLSCYKTVVIFSGDSDFLALVKYLRNHGKKVYIFSSRNNVSEELRTGADGYTDILKIECDIWSNKPLQYRLQKK